MKKNTNQADKSDVVISIHGLVKNFGPLEVLKGIDIDIYNGENLAVLGRSGSGKSVLIKIIAGLLLPDEGTVRVLGKEVNKLNAHELQHYRRKIGFSFQNSALYDSMTVRENLEFPLVRNKRDLTAQQVEDAVKDVLQNVGLPKTINQMPSELSGGQRKRIGIARTLILHPQIMLYDEPTSGLDPLSSIELNNLINQVQQQYNTTSVIITHDLTCAKQTADRVAIIEDGRFIENGSFDEVFKATDKKMVKDFYDYNFTKNT